ncbi:MAG: DUF2442 domain-containing protein [Candidatus Binatia bacterium]
MKRGMNIVANTEPRIRDIKVTSDTITAYLVDGRTVSVPLAWSWRLSEATPAQRAKWRLIGDGQGTHWPDVDEDISIEGMLRGVPAHRPRDLKRFLDATQQVNGKPATKRSDRSRRTQRSSAKR